MRTLRFRTPLFVCAAALALASYGCSSDESVECAPEGDTSADSSRSASGGGGSGTVPGTSSGGISTGGASRMQYGSAYLTTKLKCGTLSACPLRNWEQYLAAAIDSTKS